LSYKVSERKGIEVEVIDGIIYVKHDLNYVCCAKLQLSYEFLKSKPPIIKITEINNGDVCRCMCTYEIEATIGPLPKGKYVLQLWGVEYRDHPASLLFEKTVEIKSETIAWTPAPITTIPPITITPPQEEFCGYSTYGNCNSDADCITGGCSGQVCQSRMEEPVITTCEFRECYNAEIYAYKCRCLNKKCQWKKGSKFMFI